MMGTIITVIILIMIIGALITYWPIVLAVTAIGVIIGIVIKLKKRSGHEKYIKDYYSTDNSSNIHSSYDFKKTDKDIDDLDGVEFEKYISRLLWMKGYTFVQTTKASGDYGIDIIATKGNQKYGIQCKRYSGTVGNHAVMEAYTGAAYYQCDVAVVCTSNYFTNAAKEQASKVGVQLWDRDEIEYMIKNANGEYTKREKHDEAANGEKPAVVIDCPQCGKKFRVYAEKGSMLEMKCPHCSYKFIERV